MEKTKFYKLLIAILLLINLGTLFFFWWNRPPQPGEQPRLTEVLKLKGEVAEKVTKLELKHHRDKRALIQKSSEIHAELYKDLTLDPIKQEIYLDELADIERENDDMTFKFFREIASYCNENQREELRKIIDRAIDKKRGEPRR